MMKERYTIDYVKLSGPEELSSEDASLVSAAISAQQSSYAPYSHFNVGAAVRLEDGTIITGSNQENMAYPSGLCAERCALFSAGSQYPGIPVSSIAVAGGPEMSLSDDPLAPCGACRQVMLESQARGGQCISVILVGKKCIYKFDSINDLLPFSFDL